MHADIDSSNIGLNSDINGISKMERPESPVPQAAFVPFTYEQNQEVIKDTV
jgi:hypothetical protein